MSLGAVRASPLGESAPQLGSRPNDTPQWQGVGDGFFLSFARELILCAMRSMSIMLLSHFHRSALHMMADGYRGNEHAISFVMYKLRLQTWCARKPARHESRQVAVPSGSVISPLCRAHRRRNTEYSTTVLRTVKYSRAEC